LVAQDRTVELTRGSDFGPKGAAFVRLSRRKPGLEHKRHHRLDGQSRPMDIAPKGTFAAQNVDKDVGAAPRIVRSKGRQRSLAL
jgi:hypothetical protein